jgi:hypothetical protein
MEEQELSLRRMFYPYGFPLEIRTNSAEMMLMMEETWGVFAKRFDYEPLRTDIRVVESDVTECPPAPIYRLMQPMLTAAADKDNYLLRWPRPGMEAWRSHSTWHLLERSG